MDGLAEALGVRPPGRRHNGRRRGGSSAGQSSGLIIRQVVGSSPTRPTDFLVDSLTNLHPVSPTVTECHQVMRTQCVLAQVAYWLSGQGPDEPPTAPRG